MSRIKVMVVDDSAVVRQVVAGLLADDPVRPAQAFVLQAGQLTTDPDLDQDEAGPADGRRPFGVAGDGQLLALRRDHPLDKVADDLKPRRIEVVERHLHEPEPPGGLGQAVEQLR